MWGAYIAKTLVKRDVTVVQSVSPERGRRVMGLPRRDRPHQAGGVLGSSKCGCCGFLGASRKAFQGLSEGPVEGLPLHTMIQERETQLDKQPPGGEETRTRPGDAPTESAGQRPGDQ